MSSTPLRRGRCTPALLGLAAVLALVLSGCGSRGSEVVDAADDPDNASTAEVALQVECGSSRFDMNHYAAAPPASSLPDGPAGATDDLGRPAFDPSLAWKVVHQSVQRVDLLRELDEPVDTGDGDERTHEARALQRITGVSGVANGTWLLASAGSCTPRLLTDSGLNHADLTLAGVPSPDAVAIDLLVSERACASGTSAAGRIELIELRETPEEVSIRIGVRPRGSGGTCPGNPKTPFVVELSEPLGERTLVDASVVPPRVISADTAE